MYSTFEDDEMPGASEQWIIHIAWLTIEAVRPSVYANDRQHANVAIYNFLPEKKSVHFPG